METEASLSEIKSLLRLLDDEHPPVRRAVQERLAAYGASLPAALRDADPDLSESDFDFALRLGRERDHAGFFQAWKRWLEQPTGLEKLESGMVLIASYLGRFEPEDAREGIPEAISQLAMDHELECGEPTFRTLADSLFQSGEFAGAKERYYHPDSSNLAAVLQTREGNPISLACIYMLVAGRLGIDVGGCNYPVHFLARARDPEDGELYLIDCFNQGRVIHCRDLIDHHPLSSTGVSDVVRTPASAELILSRVLRNLENAFHRLEEPGERALMTRLWKLMADEYGDQV